MKKIFVLSALAFSLQLSAQDNPVKDQQLKSLIQQAVTNYPKLKEIEEQLKASDIEAKLIKENYQPNVSSTIGYQFMAPVAKVNFGNETFQFQPYNNYNAAVTVNQLIYDFGKTKLQLEKNKAEKELNNLGLENTKNAIAFQVAQIYFNIQFYEKAVTVQQDQLKSLKENENLIQAKINNGDALQYDLLTTQVRTSNATNRLNDLQSQLQKQYVLMQWLTGVDAKGKIAPADQNTSFNLVQLAGDWQTTNPDAKLIQSKLNVYRYDLEAVKVSNRPTLGATAGGGFRNGYQPEIQKLKLNGLAGVSLNIPLFNGGRVKLQQQLAQVQIDATKKSLATLESGVQKDLATIAEDYKNLENKYGNTAVLVTQAEKAYALALVRFKEGLITNVELLGAQTNVEDAKLQQVQLQYQMQLDKLESHKVIGTRIY